MFCMSLMLVLSQLFSEYQQVDPVLGLSTAVIPVLLLMHRVCNYLQELRVMDQQLAEFSVRHARCFCCDNHHVNPHTGQFMTCDRRLVYASIAHWFANGGSMDQGLDKFDYKVRRELREQLHRYLGRLGQLPYMYAILIGIPRFLFTLDPLVKCPLGVSLVLALEALLLRYPSNIAIMLLIVRWGSRDSAYVSKCRRLAHEIFLVGLCSFLGKVTQHLSEYCIIGNKSIISTAVWLLVEAFIVLHLYFNFLSPGKRRGSTTG
eukprot:TRINITY_DN8122_c0_g2_i1.p1 TRINITY_DN8122_c0_g2~~TRINITY_DN8122_c0_g2_i1.p1  ORF type:complete len:262 (+),score=10.66 TRINITY_DN8122_c0_g2_i1:479-1264(+)